MAREWKHRKERKRKKIPKDIDGRVAEEKGKRRGVCEGVEGERDVKKGMKGNE